jgi:hypothetical protein
MVQVIDRMEDAGVFLLKTVSATTADLETVDSASPRTMTTVRQPSMRAIGSCGPAGRRRRVQDRRLELHHFAPDPDIGECRRLIDVAPIFLIVPHRNGSGCRHAVPRSVLCRRIAVLILCRYEGDFE